MTSPTTCDNPMCTCDPCTCETCRCGAARLGELERQVMDIVWEKPGRERTIREVAEGLPDHAYTTVATVLDRLAQKGLVRRAMKERTIRFVAVGSRGAHTAVLMHEALAVDRDSGAALERFAELLSRSEAEDLRRALTRREPRPRTQGG